MGDKRTHDLLTLYSYRKPEAAFSKSNAFFLGVLLIHAGPTRELGVSGFGLWVCHGLTRRNDSILACITQNIFRGSG